MPKTTNATSNGRRQPYPVYTETSATGSSTNSQQPQPSQEPSSLTSSGPDYSQPVGQLQSELTPGKSSSDHPPVDYTPVGLEHDLHPAAERLPPYVWVGEQVQTQNGQFVESPLPPHGIQLSDPPLQATELVLVDFDFALIRFLYRNQDVVERDLNVPGSDLLKKLLSVSTRGLSSALYSLSSQLNRSPHHKLAALFQATQKNPNVAIGIYSRLPREFMSGITTLLNEVYGVMPHFISVTARHESFRTRRIEFVRAMVDHFQEAQSLTIFDGQDQGAVKRFRSEIEISSLPDRIQTVSLLRAVPFKVVIGPISQRESLEMNLMLHNEYNKDNPVKAEVRTLGWNHRLLSQSRRDLFNWCLEHISEIKALRDKQGAFRLTCESIAFSDSELERQDQKNALPRGVVTKWQITSIGPRTRYTLGAKVARVGQHDNAQTKESTEFLELALFKTQLLTTEWVHVDGPIFQTRTDIVRHIVVSA